MQVSLLSGKHYRVTHYPLKRAVWLVRAADSFTSLSEVRNANQAVLDCLMTLGNSQTLVVDMRAAPSRNDSDFEHAMQTLRSRLIQMFPRAAVLVQTAAGRMQVSRLGRDEGHTYQLCTSEQQAWDFVEARQKERVGGYKDLRSAR